jgi:23S rRNA (uracil1939-C5)-methyltransferase
MGRQKSYEAQTIESVEFHGNGVTKPEGRVVFVEGTLPGEVVDVRVTRRKRDHAFGIPTRFHSYSSERVEPFCEHFQSCGGCTWQYLPYERQLVYKEQFVRDMLLRIGKITDPQPLPIIGCETDRLYRNKLEFSFSPTRWLEQEEIDTGEEVNDRRALGLHVKGRFDRVIDINTCHLQPEPSNRIRLAAREIAVSHGMSFHDPREHRGLLRSLIIRTTRDGEVMVVLVVGEKDELAARTLLDEVKATVPQITSTHFLVNETKNDDLSPHPVIHHRGSPTITERCGPLELAIHPKSFYQTNSSQAERLYGVVREWAELGPSDHLLDLYCGIGSIGLFLADRAGRVTGVEYVEEAVACARENAALNGFSNTVFHAGDVREILGSVGTSVGIEGGIPFPDVMVLDPPRAGVHPEVIEQIVRIAPRQLIYVSCKPSTQARDLAALSNHYAIKRIQPVDMFPQTFHIENVVDLRLATEGDR